MSCRIMSRQQKDEGELKDFYPYTGDMKVMGVQ
jgi:hypothetical protein